MNFLRRLDTCQLSTNDATTSTSPRRQSKRPLLFTLLISLAFLNSLPFSHAQDTNTTNRPPCITLTNTKTCPNQEGLQVQSVPSLYNSTATFDSYIQSNYDVNPSYISSFKTGYGCPGYDGTGQRYHISFFCAILVDASRATCGDTTTIVKPLCRDTCIQARQSLSSLFDNATVCSPALAVEARGKTISQYTAFCGNLSIESSAGAGRCDSGSLSQEVDTCGFWTKEEAKAFCATALGNSDPCCTKIRTPTNNTNGAGTGTGAANGSGVRLPQDVTSQPNTGTATKTVITGIVAGIGGVAFVAISVLLVRQYRLRKRMRDIGTGITAANDRKPGFDDRTIARSPTFKNDVPPISTDSATLPYRSLPNSPSYSVTPTYVNSAPSTPSTPTSILSPTSPFRIGPPPQLPLPSVPSARFSNTEQFRTGSPVNAQYQDSEGSRGSLAGSTLTRVDEGSQLGLLSSSPGRESGRLRSGSAGSSAVNPATGRRARMKVWAEYIPELEDEVALRVGDLVDIMETFSDGWATGENLTTRVTGVFPLACLIVPNSSVRTSAALSRVSTPRGTSMQWSSGSAARDSRQSNA